MSKISLYNIIISRYIKSDYAEIVSVVESAFNVKKSEHLGPEIVFFAFVPTSEFSSLADAATSLARSLAFKIELRSLTIRIGSALVVVDNDSLASFDSVMAMERVDAQEMEWDRYFCTAADLMGNNQV